ncbi:hypothetical protein BD779DRAFT_1526312 [Infundibulicybe gibba]|nr:hypothetical protein BD779DRAFT_1526312 [Infundibulicybe gibba]
MSAIGTWLWGTSHLDDAVDKATSELLPSGAEDIALNLEICDQIRSKSIPAKDAMRALKRRLNHKNPNVQLLALGLTDICIKNGGDHFLSEVASREFMDNLVSILHIPTLNLEVKNAILRHVQNWSIAFEGKPTLGYVGQIYKILNNEGYKFPPKDPVVANSAMVDTQTAPEWIDSDVCLRCRTPFSFTNRKHHCRNCGQVFDQGCSSKTMPLPHFGIAQEVRVCDSCYSKLSKRGDKTDKGHRHSTSLHGHRHRSARELADAELQRAIQLSLQEVGAVNGHARPGYTPSQPSSWQYSEPPIVDRSTQPNLAAPVDEEDDPDLRAAIEASLREATAPKPSAPVALETPRIEGPSYSYDGPGYSQSYPPGVLPPQPSLPQLPNYDLGPMESDAILTFSQTVEQVQAQGGRDISRYPAVNELYDKANGLRPKLALSLDDAGRKEQMLSEMHDKLSEAVKLYDKLLTQQSVAQTPAPHQAQQPVSSGYSPAYVQPNGYNQWTPQPQATAGPTYQRSVDPTRQPQSPPISYAPAPSKQEQYPGTLQAETSHPQWQPQYIRPLQPTMQTQSYAPQVPSPPPQSQQAPTQTQFATNPAAFQSHSAMSPTIDQVMPPVSYAAPQGPFTSPQAAAISQTPVAVPSPPTTYSQPPSLTRHNTLTQMASPPLAPNTHLSRSNTVAHPVHQHEMQRYQQQQIASPPPPPQVSLTQFPVAPTSAPQSFPMYGPSIPSGVAQTEERKEALLIDL